MRWEECVVGDVCVTHNIQDIIINYNSRVREEVLRKLFPWCRRFQNEKHKHLHDGKK